MLNVKDAGKKSYNIMKISIAVPSYNHYKYIYACLKSIQDQDYDNYEVLISDGGSTDDSLKIIKDFCETDKRFTLVSQSDNGQADAIMKSFGFASGDIFCFLNSDDIYLTRDVFKCVASSFQSNKNVDIISFNGCYIDFKGKYIKQVNLRYHPLDSSANMKYRTAVLQPATFWKKEVYLSIPINTNYHFAFDAMFFYEAYSKFSWLDLSKSVAGHRLHGLNKSSQICPERINELAELERLKFGPLSYRVYYLRIISSFVAICTKIPFIGKIINKSIYFVVNSISFITFYRIPSI